MKLQDLCERASFQHFDDVFEYMINACRPALSQLPTPLYRGMHYVDNHDKIISGGTRGENDDSMRMSRNYTKLFDKWMTEHFGHPYLAEGIFVSGDAKHAANYGDVFLMIPIGQFDYVWSPNVGDQIDLEHQWHMAKNPESYEDFSQYMEHQQYTNKNIGQAVKTDHEIIIRCERYFHLSMENVKKWGGKYSSLEELYSDLRG